MEGAVPTSYWQATASLGEITTDVPPSCDVLVIGGGLLGVAAAYFLARAGADVVVLERHGIGAGATARNGGFVVGGTAEAYPLAIRRHGRVTAREVWQFTLDNRRLMEQVLAEEEIVCGYRTPGHLGLASDESELALMAETVRCLKEDGFAAEMLDRRQLEDAVPARLATHIVAAIFGPGDGQLHSARFVYGFARAAFRSTLR